MCTFDDLRFVVGPERDAYAVSTYHAGHELVRALFAQPWMVLDDEKPEGWFLVGMKEWDRWKVERGIS